MYIIWTTAHFAHFFGSLDKNFSIYAFHSQIVLGVKKWAKWAERVFSNQKPHKINVFDPCFSTNTWPKLFSKVGRKPTKVGRNAPRLQVYVYSTTDLPTFLAILPTFEIRKWPRNVRTSLKSSLNTAQNRSLNTQSVKKTSRIGPAPPQYGVEQTHSQATETEYRTPTSLKPASDMSDYAVFHHETCGFASEPASKAANS